MSEISERYWKRNIPVHQLIQTSWGEVQEMGISASHIIVRLPNGDIKFIEESKIEIKEGIFEYVTR